MVIFISHVMVHLEYFHALPEIHLSRWGCCTLLCYTDVLENVRN